MSQVSQEPTSFPRKHQPTSINRVGSGGVGGFWFVWGITISVHLERGCGIQRRGLGWFSGGSCSSRREGVMVQLRGEGSGGQVEGVGDILRVTQLINAECFAKFCTQRNKIKWKRYFNYLI